MAINHMDSGAELNVFNLTNNKKLPIQFFANKKIINFAIDATASLAALIIDNNLVICDLKTKTSKTSKLALSADEYLYAVIVDDAGNTALIKTTKRKIWINLKNDSIIRQFDDTSTERYVLSPEGSKIACYDKKNQKLMVYKNLGAHLDYPVKSIVDMTFSFDGSYVIAYDHTTVLNSEKSSVDEGLVVVYDARKNVIAHKAPCYFGSAYGYGRKPIFQDSTKRYFVYYDIENKVARVCDCKGTFKVIDQIPVPLQQDSKVIKAAFFGPTVNTVLFGGYLNNEYGPKSFSYFDHLYAYDRSTKQFKQLFADLGQKIQIQKIQSNSASQLIFYDRAHDWEDAIFAALRYDLQHFNPQQVIAISCLIELSKTVPQKHKLEKPKKTMLQALGSFLLSQENNKEQHSEPEEQPLIDANSWLYKVFKTLSATEQQRLLDGYPALKELMPKK